MSQIRIFLVDDQSIIRDGLRYMIDHQQDMVVVGTASTVTEALDGMGRTPVDVLLLDIRLPDGSGLDIARAARQLDPAPKTLLLTTFDVDLYVLEALRAGAMGYVLKDLPTPELLQTIRAVYRGEAMYRTQAASWALTQAVRPAYQDSNARDHNDVELLTEREQEVLQRMSYGERNADIARALFVSEGTVKTHVHSILQKLQVEDRTQAVVWAFRHGLVR
ncbi:MAG: DNA-binding response regulator [Sulfobacillus acidophilus]|uniref:Stage 0 sporulation protein A homolog n=1 Tax=Sulfobacillus acidophilus TaxID=53633 RepID=A0A2T2WF90_9FIRM|nr:MAG: DNA-binding response regulator [Sulfobacillus acidophilus]